MRSGFDIGPGQHAKVDIQAQVRERLPAPYESCSHDEYIENNVESDDPYKYKYTVHGAMGLCVQKEIIKQCQCKHPGLPVTHAIFEQPNITSCYKFVNGYTQDELFEVATRLNCMKEVIRKTKCDHFKQPCKEKKYTKELTQVPWPHESSELGFYRKYINGTDHQLRHIFRPRFENYEYISEVIETNVSLGMEMLREETLIERNFIQLQVQFQVIKYLHISSR